MNIENLGSVWEIDHCYPIPKTNLSKETDMFKSTYWIKLRPMYWREIISKGSKIDHHLYIFQEIKATYFLKLIDQEGFNQVFFDEIYSKPNEENHETI